MQPNPANPVRLQTSILSAAEKRLLVWIAGRLPAAVGSDHLTILALAAMILAGMSYWFASQHPAGLVLASVSLAINWFGDSLDGTLARYRHIERPRYGYFVDHTTDAVVQVLIFLGLGLSPFVTYNIATLALVGYLILSVLVYLRTYIAGEFKISYAGLGPTESRAVAVLLNTAMFFFGFQSIQVGRQIFSLYDMPVLVVAVVLFGFFTDTAIRETRRLAALGE